VGNIKVDFKETGREDVGWIQLARVRVQWRTLKYMDCISYYTYLCLVQICKMCGALPPCPLPRSWRVLRLTGNSAFINESQG
jgi:hypothetical protein